MTITKLDHKIRFRMELEKAREEAEKVLPLFEPRGIENMNWKNLSTSMLQYFDSAENEVAEMGEKELEIITITPNNETIYNAKVVMAFRDLVRLFSDQYYSEKGTEIIAALFVLLETIIKPFKERMDERTKEILEKLEKGGEEGRVIDFRSSRH